MITMGNFPEDQLKRFPDKITNNPAQLLAHTGQKQQSDSYRVRAKKMCQSISLTGNESATFLIIDESFMANSAENTLFLAAHK